MCDLCNLNDLEYENIHSHSMFSNIYTPDSIISKEDIAIRAKELGHKTLSLVEHGYFSSIFDTYQISQKHNLNLIFGSEVYFVKNRFEKDNTNAHLLIMARNEEGRKEITSIISESNKTGFYFKPRIDEELLFSLTPENVLVTTACLASPIRKYGVEYAEYFIPKCRDYFGDSFFLEVQPHTMTDQVEFNQQLKIYRNQFQVPFILGIDSHYIYPQDAKKRTMFLQGKDMHYPEEEGMIIDFPTTKDVVDRFKNQGVLSEDEIREAFNNTLLAREFEPVVLADDIKMPSLYPDLSHEEKAKKLQSIIGEEWKKDRQHIDKSKWKEYLEAIRLETDIVTDTNMEDYFIMNYEIIKRATEQYNGVLTRTGRGSGPSFYINKLLGFTEIDRLEAPIQLYPTRFMSKSRILETRSLPDVDFNTSDSEPFIKATKDLLGEDNAYLMTAYGTMKDNEAFRNYCRALNLNISEYNSVALDLDSYRNNKKWGPIIEESKMFIGVIDSVSPHPCAVVLMDKPVSEELGVIKVGDIYTALIDSDNSDKYKYLKNDYLTVTVWDIIAKAYKAINQPIDDVRTLTRKTEGDSRVWDLYEKGLVSTLNQTGTESGKPQVMKYKPKNIRELSGWVSAIRPAFSSMKSYFLNREEFSYGIPEFDKILESSDNFVLYQENIMATLVYSGFSEDETYGLLKAIAKKKEGIIEPIHDKFIKGFTDKTGSKENALRVWKIIEDAVGYGFNSSHAYSVALDSLYGAYLKANYPYEYYSVILEIYKGSTKKIAEIEQELKAFGINIGGIKFGKSRGGYTVNKETNTINKGISSIKFLNEKIADNLYELSQQDKYKNGKVHYLDLFLDILDNSLADLRQVKILINLNFFEEFGPQEVLLNVWNTINDKGFPYLVDEKYHDRKKYPLFYNKTHSQKTKDKRLANIKEYIKLLEANPPAKTSVYELIQAEREFIGYAITKYPEVSSSYVVVTDISTKYTPVVDLYQLKTGETIKVKIKKNKFYDTNDNPVIRVGNIIKILKTHTEYGKKLIDGKWYDNKDVTWIFVDQLSIIS